MIKKFIPFAFLFMSGCFSSVKTYDRNGNLLGECKNEAYLFGYIPLPNWAIGSRGCTGSANPKDQTTEPMPILLEDKEKECEKGQKMWIYNKQTHEKEYGCFHNLKPENLESKTEIKTEVK